MKQFKLGLLAAMLCGSAAAAIPVVAGFSILGDVAKQIGGDRVTVESLVGPDADAHAYVLKPADVRKLKNARLILLNGLGLEDAELLRAAKNSGVKVVQAAEGIKALPMAEDDDDHDHDHEHEHHHHGEFDPHVWNDPVRMRLYAANVAQGLIAVDPEGRTYYQKRLADYQQQLKDAHEWAKKVFDAIPESERKVLTGHDAFGYMGARYHIRFIAPQGVTTDAEPSARDVAAIIRQIKDQHIKAVFTENIKDGRLIRRIADETGVKVQGQLYSDALSNGAPAATYLDMFRHNVKSIGGAMH